MGRLIYTSTFMLMVLLGLAQLHVAKPIKTHPKYTDLTFCAGIGRSVLFMERNVKEKNDATGYYFSAQYGGAKGYRFTGDVTQFRPLNISPTWENIRASSYEINFHLLTRFSNTNIYFFPIFGFSFNHFKGFFTGKNDFQHVSATHPVDSYVTTNWFGANVGTGFEYVHKNLGAFFEYKMRVGASSDANSKVNIMDVFYSFGLKFKLRVPSIYKILSGTRNRYQLHAN